MTTKLKTLKDFEFDDSYTENEKERILDAFFEIKQEAIKWIKNNELHIENWRVAFKHFFNITEEDLE